MSERDLQTTTLHNLIDRIQGGDDAARDELLRRVCDRLERLCRKMLGRFPGVRRWEQTGDVLQNALMRLLRSLQEIRPASTRDFFGLAAEHIRRELIDLTRHYQAERRLASQPITPIGQGLADSSSASDWEPPAKTDDNLELERWCAFHEAVEKLPVEEREVVGLVFYHGWTQLEVADLFQVNERTIRRRWQSACLKMQELLGGEIPQF